MSTLSLVRVAALLFIGILLVPTPSLGASGSSGGSVTTPWPVDLFGAANFSTKTGAALLHPASNLGGMLLRAESLVIDFHWERGVEVNKGLTLFQHVTDFGRDEIVLHDATVRFARAHDEPLVLPFDDGRAMGLFLAAPNGLSLEAAQSDSIVRAGNSPEVTGTADDRAPGFWYSVDPSQVEAVGAGTLRAHGDFSLFVHQIAIQADDADSQWAEWTGYRQEDPGAAVTEYELRVTTLHVTNGSFISPSAERAALYAEWLQGSIDGTVSSFGVTGHVESDDAGAQAYDEELLRLHGEGTVRASTVGASDGDDQSQDTPASLRIHLSGAFHINEEMDAGTPAAARHAAAPVMAVSLGSAGLLTVGLMTLGIVPGPTPASRRRRHHRWMRKGRNAMDEGDFSGAAGCFHRATRVKRSDPLAWFKWAQAELEAGRPDAADEVARQAMQIPGADRWDLIDLRASAAWKQGDLAAFQALLAELARAAPEMAQGLVADLGVDGSLLRSDVRRLLGAPEPGGGVDGYV